MEGKSVIPLAFWYCSLGGGIVLSTYAIYREEPVFIAGQLPGIIVYSRNLYFIYRDKRAARNEHRSEGSEGVSAATPRRSSCASCRRRRRNSRR